MPDEQKTVKFYDQFWPAHPPNLSSTKQYIDSLLPKSQHFKNGLDAGCGPGVTSIALAAKCDQIWAIDISPKSLDTARKLAKRFRKNNIRFKVTSLLNLPFENQHFDLVFSWGVIHHTQKPFKAMAELCRVLKKSGILVLAVYQKTWLTPIHELMRIICIHLPSWGQKIALLLLNFIVKVLINLFKWKKPKRSGVSIEAQVKDWFFVPKKYFFSKNELKKIFNKHNINFEVVEEYNGRFRSTSNMVVMGKKTKNGEDR